MSDDCDSYRKASYCKRTVTQLTAYNQANNWDFTSILKWILNKIISVHNEALVLEFKEIFFRFFMIDQIVLDFLDRLRVIYNF